MGILNKLKSALGIGGSSAGGRRDETNVTVEREPDAETEAAVKGTSDAEPVATGTDADASTGSLVDETEASEDAAGVAEPAEAAGPDSEDRLTDAAEATEEPATDAGASDHLTDIKGIGPAYADRLAGAGVETVDDLVAADPAELGDSIGVSETRVQRWIDRATE